MPPWAIAVVSVSAVITALGLIYKTVGIGVAKLITTVEALRPILPALLPVLPSMAELAGQWPEMQERLDRIEVAIADLREELRR